MGQLSPGKRSGRTARPFSPLIVLGHEDRRRFGPQGRSSGSGWPLDRIPCDHDAFDLFGKL